MSKIQHREVKDKLKDEIFQIKRYSHFSLSALTLRRELAWIVPVAPHFLHTVAWMSRPMFCQSPCFVKAHILSLLVLAL